MKLKGVGDRKLDRVAGQGRVVGAAAAPQAAAAGPAKAARQPTDDVALSSTGRLVGAAGEVVANTSDVRADRVQPLRDSIAAGHYDVASLKVADRILRQVLQERRRGR